MPLAFKNWVYDFSTIFAWDRLFLCCNWVQHLSILPLNCHIVVGINTFLNAAELYVKYKPNIFWLCLQSLKNFVNKHLDKINLEVTDLDNQVWTVHPASRSLFVILKTPHSFVKLYVLLFLVPWRRVFGFTDGFTWGLLCASSQLPSDADRLWSEGAFTSCRMS